jgi:hypothetical protein
MKYKDLFKKLWADYSGINPSVNNIHSLLQSEGESIVNDHIAFRTFDLPTINIEKLSKAFLECGYKEMETYYFDEKKLNAKHFEHEKDKMAPKVFISELITDKFSQFVQEKAKEVELKVIERNVDPTEIIFLKNVWHPISYNEYSELLKESEYAAWLYVYGFRANHFTIFINYLKKYNSIEKLNQFLIKNGFTLNSSGGVIKGSEKDLLKQSSILADKIQVNFEDGVKEIPCCYYEFAERYHNHDDKLFNGFIAKSADKIFESTNTR